MTAPTAKIRTLIVDDERLARKRIRQLLDEETDIEVLGECGDAHEAVEWINGRAPDLVFLDVQMPGDDGFAMLRTLDQARLPALIFVTAYDQYALRAFEVQALDYLLKPFDRPRFQAALDRARSHIRGLKAPDFDRRLASLVETLEAKQKAPDRIVVKSSGKVSFLKTDEIDWIEAADNYVRLHVGAESHMLRETLGSIAARLDPAKFLRIHRSTVININRLKQLQPWFHGDYVAILEDGTKLNLSRTYRDKVNQALGEVL
jgi:two-component system LytT family response regulator